MKELLFKVIRYSGIPNILRKTIQRQTVTIFTFHDPLPQTFESTVKYLRKFYSIIPLSHYLNFIYGKGKIPENSVILTLDDGHKNNFNLLKIIKEYSVPITIFLCSEIIDTNRQYWWTYNVQGYKLKSIKRMKEYQRRNFYKENGLDYLDDFGIEKRQALNMDEIKAMLSCGNVDFQSHTMFHALLDSCTDSLATEEIQSSKKNLETKLNLKIYALAYPNGIYSQREIEIARQSGYKCALTTEPGFNNYYTDPFKIKRFNIRDKAKMDEIIVSTSGIWGIFRKAKIKLFPSKIY